MGIVTGNIVSTRKNEAMVGFKLLEVHVMENGGFVERYLIAVDTVGAGIGEKVLVTAGSAARVAAGRECPVDAAIVGIVDN